MLHTSCPACLSAREHPCAGDLQQRSESPESSAATTMTAEGDFVDFDLVTFLLDYENVAPPEVSPAAPSSRR